MMQTKRSYRPDNSARKNPMIRLLLLNSTHLVWLLPLLLLLIARPVSAAFLTFVEVHKDGVGGVDGLNGTFSVMVSPDGAHVYAAGFHDDAVAVFNRNPSTGALTFVEVQKDGIGGVDGLDGAYSVTVSPDGAHVYAAGLNEDAVAVFSRNPTTGSLTFIEVQRDGVGGVDGLDGVASVTVSPDGQYAYAVGNVDHAVVAFSRNPTTGGLTFVEVQKHGVGGVDGLQQAFSVTVSPDNQHVYVASLALNGGVAVFSRNTTTGALTFVEVQRDGVGGVNGMAIPRSVEVSPDGQHIYVAGSGGLGAVVVFSRNSTTGALTFTEAQKDGVGSVDGLFGVFSVAVSPDGAHVYAAGTFDDAVAVFNRNPTTGALTFVEVHKDGVGGVDGLDMVQSVTISPDSQHVYTGSQGDDAVTVFSVAATPPTPTDTPIATSTSIPTSTPIPTDTPAFTPTPTDTPTLESFLYLPIIMKNWSPPPCNTPGIPSLVSPGNGTTTNDNTPTFDWNSANNATEYQLQVDNDANFSSPEIDITTSSTDHTPTLDLSEFTYYWRVRGHNTSSGGCNEYGSWSSIWSVTIDTIPPSPPTLVSPSNGSTTSDTTPTFEWTASSNPTQYQLQVDNNANFSSPEIDTTTASLDYTPSSPLSDDTYSWRVRASDAVGNWSNWSSAWSVTIATPLPTVAFNATTYSISENNGSAPIVVTISGPSRQTVSVDYATSNGTAIAGSDYTATSGTLSFAPNQTSQTFSVPITNDLLDEPDETVNLTLSSPVNTTLGTPVNATLTIVDDDPTCNTPGIPSLVSPSDGTLTDDNTPTFDWNLANNATEYQLQVDKDASFSSPEIDITIPSTNLTPTLGLSEFTYYWRVRGHNTSSGCDEYGTWSSIWSLTIYSIWSGTTSQELPISFKVANDQITSLTVKFKKTNGPFTCTYTLNHFTDTPIIGNTFQVTGQADSPTGASVIYAITGTFNSNNTSASGDLQMTVDDILCNGDVNGTWTATKQ